MKDYFQATRRTNTIMKRSYTCQPKIYLRSKTPYFSQIPTILNLFNLKTKVKLMVKKQKYVAIFLPFLETVIIHISNFIYKK